MKFRLLALPVLALAALTLSAAEAAPAPLAATTITRSAIKIGGGSFALTKGTKLEVVRREGDFLVVKFRTTQGRIPLADTDFDPETMAPESAPAEVPATKTSAKLAPAPTPAAKTPPPALATDGKPASNYGKMVQKAKQSEQAHNDKLVKPADDVLGATAKK